MYSYIVVGNCFPGVHKVLYKALCELYRDLVIYDFPFGIYFLQFFFINNFCDVLFMLSFYQFWEVF